jgi:hypothetical protein
MRLYCCGLLIFATFFCAFSAGSDKSMNSLTIRITEASPSGTISIEVDNDSSGVIRIWKESNSWGAARWAVLLIRGGQIQTFYQNPDQGFTRNVPGFDEIASGGHIEKSLDLNGGNWRGSGGRRVRFEKGDLVIVIYDVPKQFGWSEAKIAAETQKMGVWYGVASAILTVQ